MDALQDWPEPVIRVQSVSQSGIRSLPDRYIKPPAERPCFQSDDCSGSTELINIPVVDLAMLTDDDFSCEATVKAVSDACKEWGFFQAVNHGVSSELIKKAREVWREFFHLPMEVKQQYANLPKTYEGYGSRLGVEKGAILDWGDYYFLHFLPICLMSHEKWPALPYSLREVTDEYNVELNKLCSRVMKALSIGLGLEKDSLTKAFGGNDVGVCMRVNYYPKCPQPELTLGLSRHSDPGGMTVLLVDDYVKGLQVRKNGNWVTVQPVPNAFIINIGDQIQILSNAIYKSVEHRVMVNAEHERLSMAFFYNPKSDLTIGPIPELVTDDCSEIYQPMTFDEYRLFIRKNGPKGKSHLESLKTLR